MGSDLPDGILEPLDDRVDTSGLHRMDGPTFRYEARYGVDYETRVDLLVDPGVTAEYRPVLPAGYSNTQFVLLANTDPSHQIHILKQLGVQKFVMCDTIGFWIDTKRRDVERVAGMSDVMILNEEEARSLTDIASLVGCARTIRSWGPRYVIIKKAQHGSILFGKEGIFPLPGFTLEDVVDPTGAGDAFAGAVMGYVANAGTVDVLTLRRACAYGNVLGSFAVSGRGVSVLADTDRAAVEKRMLLYREMIRIP